MEIKQIWMSADTGKKSRYAWRMLGGMAAIAALLLLLVGGGTLLVFWLDLPRPVYLLALCCGATALGVALSLRLGRRSIADATLFFLTESDQLFVMDARVFSGRQVVSSALKTQQVLRQLARQPFVPTAADEILQVEGIRENRSCYAARCRVLRYGRHPACCVYFVPKSLADCGPLLRELERRESWEAKLDPPPSRTSLGILLSTLLLAGCTALCVGSHPALARLPQGIYFPCLAAAFAAFSSLVYFLVRRQRGE